MYIFLFSSVYPSQYAPHVFHTESCFPKVFYFFGRPFKRILDSKLGHLVPNQVPKEYDDVKVNAEIGAFCSISDNVFIGGAEHPMDWVSTSPVFQNARHSGPSKRFAKFDLPKSKMTIIGNDVWIGHGVTIKQGVVIGNGAVVGSNALVTKDVPSYAVVGGMPAKLIKYRFSQEVIDRLEEIQWWNLPDEKITEVVDLFHIKNPTLEDINRYFSENHNVVEIVDGGGGVVNIRISISYDNILLERRAA